LLFDVAGAVSALSSSSSYVLVLDCAVVGVVVALTFEPVEEAALAVLLADLVAALTAIQPLSATIPTTLDTPVMVRARRAGWGRRLRAGVGLGADAISMSITIVIRANKDLGAR
jgi:hypothetical protein